jgi:hypothetical protein
MGPICMTRELLACQSPTTRPLKEMHLFAEYGDFVAVDDELAVGVVDITLEDTVDGIVLEHVDHVLEVDETENEGIAVSIRAVAS